MKKFIVTTTINPPSKAIKKYCQKKDWSIIIIGDLITPHAAYKQLEKKQSNILYLSPKDQEKKYKKLSNLIGWKSIQRRNIGFLEAYHQGADIIATVDDDNIPYDFWGENLFVNQEIEADLYEPEDFDFDPLSITKNNYLWHRGFPLELLTNRLKVIYKGKTKRKILVQADLWDGDPDIDAIARLTYKPIVKYDEIRKPYCSNRISPFNSQNTFLSRKVFPYYAVLPYIGRFDDIWGGYLLQHYFPNSVIYNKASVYQERNIQSLITNLEKEIYGYRYNLNFIQNLKNFEDIIPKRTLEFYQLYKDLFHK